jgi:hypothetical protein
MSKALKAANEMSSTLVWPSGPADRIAGTGSPSYWVMRVIPLHTLSGLGLGCALEWLI